MDELTKIRRVLSKLDAEAPHEALLVIDGTTGQNAINQVRQFRAAIGVTGLVVTKLDGTAKGGVVFALAKEFRIADPFRGLGRKRGRSAQIRRRSFCRWIVAREFRKCRELILSQRVFCDGTTRMVDTICHGKNRDRPIACGFRKSCCNRRRWQR